MREGQLQIVVSSIDSTVVATLSATISTSFTSFNNLSWRDTAYLVILGRAIAGAGGGATNAISTFVGADLVPLRKRGVIQGVNNIAMGCGTELGGFVGGAGWKAAFFNVDTGPSGCCGTRLVGNPT